MASFGDLRFRLATAFPGISLDLWDGWLTDRYQQIIQRLPWRRLSTEFVIQTAAEVNAGTVTVTPGSATVTGASTAWSAALNGRMFRVSGGEEYYAFTYVDATHGTLDRPYEGTASGAGNGYRLNQHVYPLPGAVRSITNAANLRTGWRVDDIQSVQLEASAPALTSYGDTAYYSLYVDQASSPPVMQVRLYPIPTRAAGIAISAIAEDTSFNAGNGSGAMLPWLQPGAILAGCSASAALHLKDLNAYDRHIAEFQRLISEMITIDAQQRGPAVIQMADRYSRHRVLRVLRQMPQLRRLP